MKRSGILAAVFLLTCGGLFADSVSMGFTPFDTSGFSSGQTVPQPNVAGTPFWTNYSPDVGVGGSNAMNIGYALTDTGGFLTTPALLGTDSVAGTLLGAGGSDPSAFNFTANGDSYDIEVLFSATGLPGEVTLRWYALSNPSVLNPIFSNVPNTSAPILPAQSFSAGSIGNQYGFYATVCYNPPQCTIDVTYYTNSADDTTNEQNVVTSFDTIQNTTAYNHFALFNLTRIRRVTCSGSAKRPMETAPR